MHANVRSAHRADARPEVAIALQARSRQTHDVQDVRSERDHGDDRDDRDDGDDRDDRDEHDWPETCSGQNERHRSLRMLLRHEPVAE